ncbi:MAG: amidohydrolase family protein [Chroococcidiopsidaceae cyanobacterium CP_BM_RX_35]|nr:amidohydrolase family protein [Chroococcidiopsidaceae cyanobacterium CP_BM_RX_35]
MAATVANLLPPPDGDVDRIAKLQQTLRQWSENNPDLIAHFGWVIGNGCDDSQLQEQRHPVRQELDAVSTELPVLLLHQSGHLAAGIAKR